MLIDKFLARQGLDAPRESNSQDRRSVTPLGYSLPDSASCATLHEAQRWCIEQYGFAGLTETGRGYIVSRITRPIIMGWTEILRCKWSGGTLTLTKKNPQQKIHSILSNISVHSSFQLPIPATILHDGGELGQITTSPQFFSTLKFDFNWLYYFLH